MARTFKPKLKTGHRSRLEQRIGDHLDSLGVPYGFESMKIPYKVPERASRFMIDFVLPNGIIVEAKGWPFDSKDRQKHLLIREQHPELDIRFVFENPANRINPGSQTTYADWCLANGFKYAAKLVPQEWLDEETTSTTTKKSSSPTSRSTKRRTSKTRAS